MSYEKYKNVLDSVEARQNIKNGIEIATKLIAPTLGARGKKVVIQNEFTKPDVLDDGAKILDKIVVKDTRHQVGIDLLKDATGQTNDKAGDGTTTSTILAHSLVQEIIKDEEKSDKLAMVNMDADSLRIKKELKIGLDKVINFIDSHKLEITTDSQLVDIGRVSANSEEIGKILAELFKKLGKDAAITNSEGQGLGIEYEVIEGMKFDKGFISAGFVTDGEKERAVIKEANILVTDYKVQNPQDIGYLKSLIDGGKINDLVIIAEDVSSIPLEALVFNKVRGGLRTLAVRAPGFGASKEHLKDIATLVGATLVSKDNFLGLKDIKPEHLGKASSVISTIDTTTIIGGGGTKELISERINFLQSQVKLSDSAYEKEKLKERISKLSGGVGVIKVGGATPIEVEEKRAKLDDAVNAVRGALEDGVVAGGGVILLRATEVLGDNLGETILKNAIVKPFEQIMRSAGMDIGKSKSEALSNKNINWGYNVESETWGDMIKMGIIDPAKVTKTALQSAVSLAILVSDSAGAIVNVREEKDKTNPYEGATPTDLL